MQVLNLSRKIYFRLFVKNKIENDCFAYWGKAREIEGFKMSFGTILTMAGGLGLFLFGMESCKSAEVEVSDHFADAVKMVEIGSNAVRDVDDIMLTRYACYLIAQNGDPRKEEIAFAQSYFAVQTRKQELIEERIAYIQRTEARGKLREYENLKKDYRKIFMSVAWMMLDLDAFVQKVTRHYLVEEVRRK